jgi:hypothetical protein
MRIIGEQLDEVVQREERAVEHERTSASLTRLSVAGEFDGEASQLASPRFLARRDRVALPNQERAVEGICRYCVERCKFPPGKNRLHHLVAERDPIDTAKQLGLIHLRRRRSTEAKHDLRLNARLSEPADALDRRGVELKGRAVGAIPPDWRLAAHIRRFVKPILRPVIFSPRASKAARRSAGRR